MSRILLSLITILTLRSAEYLSRYEARRFRRTSSSQVWSSVRPHDEVSHTPCSFLNLTDPFCALSDTRTPNRSSFRSLTTTIGRVSDALCHLCTADMPIFSGAIDEAREAARGRAEGKLEIYLSNSR